MLKIKYWMKWFSYQRVISGGKWIQNKLRAHCYSDLKHYYGCKHYSEVEHESHTLSGVWLKQRHALVMQNSVHGLKPRYSLDQGA